VKLPLLAFVTIAVAGCAHNSPEQREAELARERRCAAIEIYPPGMAPARQYRVLGPVGVSTDSNAAHRDRALRDSACSMGADAVIDIHEQTTGAATNPYATGAEQSVDVSGTAVSWSDPAR
jgi:hypothetical protein